LSPADSSVYVTSLGRFAVHRYYSIYGQVLFLPLIKDKKGVMILEDKSAQMTQQGMA
jgi:hypothetical protein